MSQVNTNCEKCYFSNVITSDKPCEFYIPDALKDKKSLKEINSFFYIPNYRCRYGVSKDTAKEKLQDFNIDIKEYAKHQVIPQYTLYIKILQSETFEQTCLKLKQLTIPPKYVHLVFDVNFDMTNIQKIADKILTDATFRWKLHKFLEDKPDYEQLYISLSTDKYIIKSDFLWILTDSMIETAIQNDDINQINFIINVEQPNLGILHNSTARDYFFGIFMTLNNLFGIWEHIGYDIDSAIKTLYTNDIGFYN